MSWLEFVVQMSSALAWPAVASGAIVLLRKQIKTAATALVERIGEIANLKAPGVSIEFRQDVEKLAESTDSLVGDKGMPAITAGTSPRTVVLPQETTDERYMRYLEVSAIDPKAAVLWAFADFESLLRVQYKRRYPNERPNVGFRQIINRFAGDGLLTEDLYGSMRELSNLRNRAAHEDTAIDAATVYYYLQSVGNVVRTLEGKGFFVGESEPQN
ncbi:hypothetical protein MINTM019_19220 [Mycobacterium paraintracellulare]|uniref:DUF4145 domain-containing protein n=2 Tax=Mycobacterium paraintracellulare TaxID=1138383 RepID=A0ABM7KBV7_9MYCO|nr:hypothetical protein B8W68_18260 [Mycobacterium paraintracellulare]BBY71624.1 hypothetical protein MPRI_38110 [Mycobacterium paraintracellulare]BCP04466.1 hypothetical protein MINTM019_19220 [Mycobacterium paraintracellulare]